MQTASPYSLIAPLRCYKKKKKTSWKQVLEQLIARAQLQNKQQRNTFTLMKTNLSWSWSGHTHLTRLLCTCGQTAPSLTAQSIPVGREEEDSSLTPRMDRKTPLINRTAQNPLMFVQVIVSSRCTEFGYSHNAAAGDDKFLSFLVVLATNTRPPRVLKEPPRKNTSGYSHRWVVSSWRP